MKTFEYEASAVDGRTVNGRTWATSELELDRDLETRGLTLLRAQQVVARRGGRHYRIDAAELINLTTQLATVVGAGVRLVEGLQGIGPRLSTPQGRLLVEDMVAGLQSGLPLSEVMERHADSFPDVYRASVRAGEASGALETVLNRLAKYMEWRRAMRSTALQAMIYPSILMCALFGLVIILLYFVLPRILGLFPGGRDSLPVETRILLDASDFLRGNVVALGLGAAAAVGGLLWALRRPGARERLHGLVLRVPRFGRIAAQLATSRFASTASILQDAGCDVYSVITVSGATCGNAAMAGSFARSAEAVRRGATITQAMEREPWMDPLLLQMVGVGEKTGELDKCLARLVQYYDDEIPRSVRRFLAFLEPAMLLLAGAIVAFILMAALMPIYSLYDKIG